MEKSRARGPETWTDMAASGTGGAAWPGRLPAGGVQRASRHVAAVAAKVAADCGMAARFLSLNDPQGLHTVRVGSLEFSVSGYAGSKIQFALAALRAAARKPALVIALHPHLAPIVWAMRARGRKFPSRSRRPPT